MTGTIRDNILFGLSFDQAWYDQVIDACCLRSDLENNFVLGDQTQVGERGITCSGGQKSRISLARAIYSCAPVVLLDDVLSAVDAHVGSRMFAEAICGLLKGRTVVFVSHQVQFLPQSDYVVLMAGGAPFAHGSYEEVMSSSKEVAKIMDFSRVGLEDGERETEVDAAARQGGAGSDTEAKGATPGGAAAAAGTGTASSAAADNATPTDAQDIEIVAMDENVDNKLRIDKTDG